MKNLQSKDMPFRTLDLFYQPTFREKSVESIKVFPQKYTNTNTTIINHKEELPSILQYISNLNNARQLPRRVGNKEQYYPLVRHCRRRRSRVKEGYDQLDRRENEQQIKTDRKSRFETIISSNPTNRSSIVYQQKCKQQRKISEQKQQMRKTRTVKKQQGSREMRFSFYNTIEKSDYFLKKFKQDSFIKQRKTNNYQNMFKRTITTENIMMLINKSKQKLKLGY